MKREADGDMGSPQKRSRRNDEEVRLLIPSKAAGSIIGKGGQNITKMRNQYKATITIPDCPGPERMLTFASDPQSVCSIISDVLPHLEQNGAKISDEELDVRMMIHHSQAGCVIGKAGAKIKELRSQTGARIKIFSNLAPHSSDRIIQINGAPFQIVNAIQEVLKLTKATPIKGAVNNYDPHNYDDYYADEYGGYGSAGGSRGRDGGGPRGRDRGGPRGGGAGGDRFGRGGPRGGGHMGGGFNDRNSRGNYGGRGMNGGNNGGGGGGGGGGFDNRSNGSSNGPWLNPPPMNNGNGLMNQPQIPPSNYGGGNMGNSGGGGNNMGGGNGYGNGNMSGNGGGNAGKSTTQVTIPKELAGAIIGKGGSRIRNIRQESGAGITIDEPLAGSNDRIITITGLPNQIQMAQYLLQQSVHHNADHRNGY